MIQIVSAVASLLVLLYVVCALTMAVTLFFMLRGPDRERKRRDLVERVGYGPATIIFAWPRVAVDGIRQIARDSRRGR